MAQTPMTTKIIVIKAVPFALWDPQWVPASGRFVGMNMGLSSLCQRSFQVAGQAGVPWPGSWPLLSLLLFS